MPLRLSIERKEAEVDCMRLGGLNKSALLSFDDEKRGKKGVSAQSRCRSVSVVYLPRSLGVVERLSNIG